MLRRSDWKFAGETSAGLPGFLVYDPREPVNPKSAPVDVGRLLRLGQAGAADRMPNMAQEMNAGRASADVRIPEAPKEEPFRPTLTAAEYNAIPWIEINTQEDFEGEQYAGKLDAYYEERDRQIARAHAAAPPKPAFEVMMGDAIARMKEEDLLDESAREAFMADQARADKAEEELNRLEGFYALGGM